MLCQTWAMSEALIKTNQHGPVGVIELWRPKALHSLNVEMVVDIMAALQRWENQDDIAEVIIVARGGKGFCAGGDVRYARERMLADDPAVEDFFQQEYQMNSYMSQYPKPIAALVNGVVMGGGMGLSAHCKYRIISPDTFGAMPEAAIGFTPDVGMTYWFYQALGDVGLSNFILGLGWHLQAPDLVWAGYATHVATDFERLEEDIYELGLEETLAQLPQVELAESQLAELAPQLSKIGIKPWAEIPAALMELPLAEDAQRFIEQANPESLVATALLVDAVAQCTSLDDALYAEYAVGKVLRDSPNFLEGVRAVLVDKDRTAKFEPATIAEVTDDFRQAVRQALAQASEQDWLAKK